MKQKLFALIDCNNFYVSCERLFNRSLINKPVVVLSNNDGCIVARSNEAKDIGIPMGAVIFKYQHIIQAHNVQVFSSNYPLYADMSSRVMRTIAHYAAHTEIYSIDEAFIDLSTCALPAYSFGLFLRMRINQWTGIPVSIGIAETKTLAKIANKIAKKEHRKNPRSSSVYDLSTHSDVDSLLATIPVADVWGVGRRYTRLLHLNGIHTAKDLKYADDTWVKKHMTVQGLRMVWELRGIACHPLEEQPQPKKAIAHGRSFSHRVSNLPKLKECIAEYTACAAQKSRTQRTLVTTLCVYVQTSYYIKHQYASSHVISLPVPSYYTPYLITYAIQALEHIFKPGYSYKKVGVILMGLIPETFEQNNFFLPSVHTPKLQRISNELDLINKKWGRRTIIYAAQGIKPTWISKRMNRTPSWTTRWDELPAVR